MMPTKKVNELNNAAREYYFRTKNKELFKKLAESTNFTYDEVEALAIIHKSMTETLGPIKISEFRDIMHSGLDFTENKRHLLIDKIFSTLNSKFDTKLSKIEFINGLSTMLNGSIDDKITFAYKTYDWLKSNKLTKDDIFPIMKGCVIKQQPDENLDESVRDMIELLIKKMDSDRDGDISIDEFEEEVKLNPFHLESFGPIFPSREARYAFLNTFSNSDILY